MVATIEVTFTVIVQEGKPPVLAGSVPPMRDKVVPTTETEPPEHVVAALAGLAKVTPVGKVSVSAAGTVEKVNGNGFGLVIEIVKTEMPPVPIESGVKKLFTCTGYEISPCALTGLTVAVIAKPRNNPIKMRA